VQLKHNTACNCMYVHTNITTRSVTRSLCPVFLFFSFINLFFSTLTYWSSADFSGWFRLNIKSRKTFDIIIPTKLCFLNFSFWEFGGGGGCRAAAPLPPWVRPWRSTPIRYVETVNGNRTRNEYTQQVTLISNVNRVYACHGPVRSAAKIFAAWFLGSRVRIPLSTLMFVGWHCTLCCPEQRPWY
jgi:hypothetical protein